jgi:hypothetical protein
LIFLNAAIEGAIAGQRLRLAERACGSMVFFSFVLSFSRKARKAEHHRRKYRSAEGYR